MNTTAGESGPLQGESAAPPARHRHWPIVLGLAVGAVGGLAANFAFPHQADGSPHAGLAWFTYNITEPIGQVFLRLIFMVVVPLVFAALALGVAGIGDVRRLGRVGLKTLLLTVLLSGIAVGLGVTLVNAIGPGSHLSAERRDDLRQRYAAGADKNVRAAQSAKSVRDTLLDLIPRNPLQEAVGALDGSSPGGGMLSVMFFALIFGVAITLVPQRVGPLVAVLEGLYDVVMAIIGLSMKLAPLAVAALVFSLTAVLGLELLRTLAWYVVTVLVGLALHTVVVYSIVVYTIGRMSPLDFFRRTSEALVTAFATSSSNATLPTSLRVAEHELGVRREISTFVLTVGATGNQNGTALFEGITVLFLAQVFGVDLTFSQQLTVVLMSVLAGVGTAGVPGGSLPLIVLVLQSVGVPGEGIGIIIGVDRILDMSRTVVNVAGDLAIAACVGRSEGVRR